MWTHYFAESHCVLYVIDSTDQSRISEALDSLETLLSEQNVQDIPIILVFNKTDVANGSKITDLHEFKARESIKAHQDRIAFAETSALKG